MNQIINILEDYNITISDDEMIAYWELRTWP